MTELTSKKSSRTQKMEQKMAHVLEVWLNNPMLSFRDIAEKAGISEQQFYRYRQEQSFMDEYERRCRERFKAMQAKALETMEILMEQGHFQAAKYTLDGNDYGGKQKLEISSTTIKVSIDEEEGGV